MQRDRGSSVAERNQHEARCPGKRQASQRTEHPHTQGRTDPHEQDVRPRMDEPAPALVEGKVQERDQAQLADGDDGKQHARDQALHGSDRGDARPARRRRDVETATRRQERYVSASANEPSERTRETDPFSERQTGYRRQNSAPKQSTIADSS